MEATGRRDDLLEKIVDVLLVQGVSDLSLRPLAEKVGSSARLLIYHFESKEKLLSDALDRVRERIQVELRNLAANERPRSTEDFLLMFWRWATAKPNQGYFRLLYEVDGLVLQGRAEFTQAFPERGVETWLKVLEAIADHPATGRSGSRARATFVHATLNGLLQDFLATGDRKRTTEALHVLIDVLPAQPFQEGQEFKRANERIRAS
jgi:AcrR family transcriptional regulator